MSDREEIERRFTALGEALGDNPPLLGVVVRANGERLVFSYPLLLQLLERPDGSEDYYAVVRVLHRALADVVDHVHAVRADLDAVRQRRDVVDVVDNL